MKLKTFFEKFDHFADSPNALERMRELVLHLAVYGKLVPQDPNDEPARKMIEACGIDLNNFEIVQEDRRMSIPEAWVWVPFAAILSYHKTETKRADEPLSPGPLHNLAKKLSFWQKFEGKRQKEDSAYKPLLRIAIITARNAPAHSRFVRTLQEWELTATETFFMGGIDKSRVLRVFKPHLFLDDQLSHLSGIADEIPCVHIPFGKVNSPKPTVEAKGG